MASDIQSIPSTMNVGDTVRYAPEPKSILGSAFQRTLSTLGGVAGAALPGGIDPEYATLIQEQIRAQAQMQLVSFVSNIEKSKHETEMVPLRNIRLG